MSVEDGLAFKHAQPMWRFWASEGVRFRDMVTDYDLNTELPIVGDFVTGPDDTGMFKVTARTWAWSGGFNTLIKGPVVYVDCVWHREWGTPWTPDEGGDEGSLEDPYS